MLRRFSRLLSPDPVDPPGEPTENPPTPPTPAPVAPTGPTPEPGPSPAPPRATQTVLEGTKTEREAALERELEEEKASRRRVEEHAAGLIDENTQLKNLGRPTPTPAPAKKESDWTFFG